MSRVNHNCVIARMRRITRSPDYVRVLLPFHLGGVYAYLANDLLIGGMVATAFLMLNIVSR